ncbi:hybrid sensor histidine kinase/response regulator [Paraburkholderia fungorum]|uniref:hybrid sensor histidine kinase/response regulator n=1 Tax=Paraburkholderia fungorum TaxID=134537 RepID=UPI0014962213|nr:hybrid sensor histidine kinase/response regulator [Paraburkholderia fungorum]
MLLAALVINVVSVVRTYFALQHQEVSLNANRLTELDTRNIANLYSNIRIIEVAWRTGERARPALVEQYYDHGQMLVLQDSPDRLPVLVVSSISRIPSDRTVSRYLRLAEQMSYALTAAAERNRGVLTSWLFSSDFSLLAMVASPWPSGLTQTVLADRAAIFAALTGPNSNLVIPEHVALRDPRTGERAFFWLPFYDSPLSGRRSLRIVAPVFDEQQKPFGFVVYEIPVDAVTAAMGAIGFDGSLLLLAPDGRVITSYSRRSVDPKALSVASSLTTARIAEPTGVIVHNGYTVSGWPIGRGGTTLVFVQSWRAIVNALSGPIGMSAATTAVVILLVWTLILLFDRRIFRPVLERSRRVFESEHLSRTLVETAPVGLGLIAVQNGEPLLRSSAMIKATEQIAVPARTLSEELVRRYGPRSGASAEQGVTREEVTLPTREGGTVDLSVSVVPARYQGHDVLVTAFTDVTAERRLERQWREAKWAADKANAAKSAFLAAMSHEIRTPMNALMGNLELLSHTPLDALQQDRLKTIRSSSDGLLAIVSDVLDFSKIEAGEMTLERLVFDAQAVAARVLRMFEPVARAKGLRLWGEFGTSTTQPMQGDPTRLGQVMNNLLSNAIKFTERGEVTLRLSVRAGQGAQGSELVIEVEDSGIGMSAGQQALLFQAFSQADATISRRFGGTGLGLALCARLTEAMGGTIAVRSEPGEGSVFTVRVPQGECAGEPGAPGAQFAGERVLFVAASPAWHAYAVAALEGWGLQVQAYRHPAQLDQAMLEEADTLILCGERNTWHADDEARLVEESSWVIDCSPEGPATPVATGRVVRVSGYGLKGLEAALRYTLQAEPLEVGHEAQGVLSRRLKVLVAEDNEVNRQLFEEQLKLLDCEVRSAQDGQDALACLSQERFDVLVTDLAMPVLDGYGLAREARARWPEMPIVAATASATLEERTRCEAAGITRVVTKPLQLDDLLTTLSEVSGVPRMAVEAAGPEGPRDGVLGGRDVPEHVRAAFLHSCERSLGVLHAASRDADGAAQVLAELHSLRGALAVFGYQALADRCAQMQVAISTNGVQRAQHMIDAFDIHLRAEVLADTTSLREILARIVELAERADVLPEIVRLVRMRLPLADLRDAEDAASTGA